MINDQTHVLLCNKVPLMSIKQNKTIRNTWKAWIVCITAALSVLYCFIQMTQLNALSNNLMAELHISFTKISILSSMYFWTNAIFILPAGILIDKFSKKNILLITLIITSISIYIFSLCHNLMIMYCCFVIIGACGAFAFLAPMSLLSNWFTTEKIALASGVTITFGFLGALINHVPLVYLINAVGWRIAMQYNAIIGIAIFIITLLAVQKHPQGSIQINKNIFSFKKIFDDFMTSCKNLQNWIFGLSASLINITVMIFGAAFGISYLMDIFHTTKIQAAFAHSMLFAGAIIGPIIFGWLSDKLKRRKLPIFLGSIFSLITILVLMCISSLNLILIYMLFFAIGILTSAQIISYPTVLESSAEEHGTLSLSICSMFIMIGSAIAIPIFGWLMDFHHHAHLIHNTVKYSIADHKFAMLILPISFIISIIVLLFGKETYCRQIA